MKEMFLGDDGKISGRRVIGTVFFVAAIVAGFVGLFVAGGWDKYIPAGGFLVAGLFLWGMVTLQNIQDIVGKAK